MPTEPRPESGAKAKTSDWLATIEIDLEKARRRAADPVLTAEKVSQATAKPGLILPSTQTPEELFTDKDGRVDRVHIAALKGLVGARVTVPDAGTGTVIQLDVGMHAYNPGEINPIATIAMDHGGLKQYGIDPKLPSKSGTCQKAPDVTSEEIGRLQELGQGLADELQRNMQLLTALLQVPNGLAGTEYAALVAGDVAAMVKSLDARVKAIRSATGGRLGRNLQFAAVGAQIHAVGPLREAALAVLEKLGPSLARSALSPEERSKLEIFETALMEMEQLEKAKTEFDDTGSTCVGLCDRARTLLNNQGDFRYLVDNGRLVILQNPRVDRRLDKVDSDLEKMIVLCEKAADDIEAPLDDAIKIIAFKPKLITLCAGLGKLRKWNTASFVFDVSFRGQAIEIGTCRVETLQLVTVCQPCLKHPPSIMTLPDLCGAAAKSFGGWGHQCDEAEAWLLKDRREQAIFDGVFLRHGRIKAALKILTANALFRLATNKKLLDERQRIERLLGETPTGAAEAGVIAADLVAAVIALGEEIKKLDSSAGDVLADDDDAPPDLTFALAQGARTVWADRVMSSLCAGLGTPGKASLNGFVLELVDGQNQHSEGARTTKVQLDTATMGGGSVMRGYFRWDRDPTNANRILITPLRVSEEHGRKSAQKRVLEGVPL